MFFKNIICPACGAACDDIQVEFRDGVIETKNICKVGNARFKVLANPHRLRQPLIIDRGKLNPFPGTKPLKKLLISSFRQNVLCFSWAVRLLAKHMK